MGDRASADSLRWNLDLILDQRGADMADLPGGERGLLRRDYMGRHFPPQPSRSRYPAAIPTSRRCKTAGTACAPAST
jgi:hypothetical protein